MAPPGTAPAERSGSTPRCWARGAPAQQRTSVIDHGGGRQGLEMVPPFVMVSADVSWQLAGMSSWASLVLS